MARLGWKSDGFTPRKRAICLEALAQGASVAAARAAEISATTFYRAEKRDLEFASLTRERGDALPQRIERKLSEFNRRIGGKG